MFGAFSDACYQGQLELAKRIFNEHEINIHEDGDALFRNCCYFGNLDTAQWLYSLGGVNIHVCLDYAFRWACYKGHSAVAMWVYSLGGVDIHADDEDAFTSSCFAGRLSIAQWIYSLGGVNIHINEEYAFRSCCLNGEFEVVKWLYSLGNIDIHIQDDKSFRNCFAFEKCYRIGKWLLQLDKFSERIVNDYAVHHDPSITKLLYDQGYRATNPILCRAFKRHRGKKLLYYKQLIRLIGRLILSYYKICEMRYQYGGVGYEESWENFKQKVLYI
ncbi:MAG: hypothetical protein Harvfovirus83_3 [Harvfovirus sp.]|uniref:Ankyrin repeat protein n=1 Tax=Harvfovirus sp. TaxID=2487768 RepID=A0A3G5A4A1_9VIRU|nr:MAG: hypothetical protein Harvfovirus83_3 [Harvfovirus sp.]